MRMSSRSRSEDVPSVTNQAKLAFLERPSAYPPGEDRVERMETHMSWVFLTDHFAYKLKKPVRSRAVDLRSLEARRLNATRELALNRRLAGDIYLDVVPLTVSPSGRLGLGGPGTPVDWLVRMHRLPRSCLLDESIRRGTVRNADVRRFTRALAAFYRRSRPVPITPQAYRARFRHSIASNRQSLLDPGAGLAPRTVERVTARQLAFLDHAPELFDRRVRARRIVEGHGDLRPEHVCMLPERPVFIDCLEFDRTLRLLDPADELAYLALECARHGAPDVGRIVLNTYKAAAPDDPPRALLAFYRSFRACIRAKLAVWHLSDRTVNNHGKWKHRAARYLAFAVADGERLV